FRILKISVDIPRFEVISYAFYELTSKSSIDYSVVIAVRKEHLLADSDKVSFRRFNHCRYFTDSSKSQNTNLWLIDNWSTENTSESTYVSYCIGSALRIVRFEFSHSSTVSQVVYGFCHTHQIQLVCIFDNRNN